MHAEKNGFIVTRLLLEIVGCMFLGQHSGILPWVGSAQFSVPVVGCLTLIWLNQFTLRYQPMLFAREWLDVDAAQSRLSAVWILDDAVRLPEV